MGELLCTFAMLWGWGISNLVYCPSHARACVTGISSSSIDDMCRVRRLVRGRSGLACMSSPRGSGRSNLIEVCEQDVPLKVDLPPFLFVKAKHPGGRGRKRERERGVSKFCTCECEGGGGGTEDR